jgi:hypothetical protein
VSIRQAWIIIASSVQLELHSEIVSERKREKRKGGKEGGKGYWLYTPTPLKELLPSGLQLDITHTRFHL